MDKIKIVFAADLPQCDGTCGAGAGSSGHYADCDCIGPGNAEDAGYEIVEIEGELYGIKP